MSWMTHTKLQIHTCVKEKLADILSTSYDISIHQ